MSDLTQRRQCFAEEVQARANLRNARLIDAIATIPRERFLPPGPWIVRGEGGADAGGRVTPDADPKHLYHNVAVAIDAERQLFNGGPAAVAPLIDALDLTAGLRVLHIGCGLGYYTALMAHVVGPTGRVVAIDVDDALATGAQNNLASFGWVEVRRGNGTEPLHQRFDAILVHAGVTHPLDEWLDGLTVGGRLVVPLTASLPQLGPLSKGLAFVVTRRGDEAFDARPLHLLVIYTAVGIRDEGLNGAIGGALMKAPFPAVTHLRRDAHEPEPSCWLHGPRFCLAR